MRDRTQDVVTEIVDDSAWEEHGQSRARKRRRAEPDDSDESRSDRGSDGGEPFDDAASS